MIFLITVKSGREDKCLMDLLDAIYIYDNRVKAWRNNYTGLIVLETRLEEHTLINILRYKPIRHLYAVIPLKYVYNTCDIDLFIKDFSREIKDVDRLWIKFRMRDESKKIEDEIKEMVREIFEKNMKKLSSKRDAKYIIHIEGFDEKVGFNIFDREKYMKLKPFYHIE